MVDVKTSTYICNYLQLKVSECMSETVSNPHSGKSIGLVERHHVESIVSAVDMGEEAPDEEDRTLRIMDSYASTAYGEIGQLDKAYGFSKIVPQVTRSLPFNKSMLSKLLFERDNSEIKEQMVASITEENKRQLEGRSVTPAYTSHNDYSVADALAGEDMSTPSDAHKERKHSWSALKR